ncbi:MAG: hypothetical protein K8M05_28950 [Deltaproteobacteria bacterium]|nr:hypothetical protein [Kofleriaceae bacterium]
MQARYGDAVQRKEAGDATGGEVDLGGGARIEGATLFSGPDDKLDETVPPVATPEKTTDAEYEESMGIKKSIADKKMLPVEGVHGASFTATGCAGKKDGKVTFTFDRAYVGDYEYAAAGKTVRGVHVSISAALKDCGEHKDVKFVQVLRNFTKKDGKVVTADPGYAKRRERSGWSDDKAPSRGWRVDGLDSDTSPFYVSGDFYGNHGSDAKALKLRDTPGNWSTDRNVGKEFRTCAVSYAGGKGTVLACIDWGYYIDDAGAATFYPAKPVATAGAVKELTDAATRWDGMEGNDKANLVP